MKIICVGRNYVEHAKELKNPVPKKPLLFFKPDTALLREKDFYYPEFTKDLHYECELVLRIGKEGKHIQRAFALNHLDGLGLGIDFTARDIQTECKQKGWPWTLAKGFDGAAPVSEFLDVEAFGNLQSVNFHCDINGELRQRGNSSDMIFPVDELLAYITKHITLKPGDMVFTGTPAGVGPVAIGDRIEGYLEGEKMLDFYVK